MMRQRFLLLTLLGLVSACGREYDNPIEEGYKGEIKGVVVAQRALALRSLSRDASVDTVPVQGAVCTLEGTDMSAETAADGSFVLRGVADGSYILICRRADSGGASYVALRVVEVAGGRSVDMGTLVITQPGSISGRAALADEKEPIGIDVYIPGTSMAARSDAQGAYVISDVPEGAYTLRLEHEGYLPVTMTNVVVRAVETTVLAEVTLPLSTGASGSIVLANGAEAVSSRTVSVKVTATADATLMALSEDPALVGAPWVVVQAETTWTFDSDGEKRLYASFSNANGMRSNPAVAKISIDTAGPVIVASLPRNTATRSVSVDISGSDVTGITEVMLSNTSDFAGAAWQPYASTVEWTLTEGSGSKTVFVKARDRFVQESEVVAPVTFLSPGVPGSIVLAGGADAVSSRIVSVEVVPTADATLMALSEDPLFVGVPWVAVQAETTWTFESDGQKTLYASFSNANGMRSNPFVATIIIDTAGPDISASLPERTTIRSVSVGIDGSDLTGITEVMLSNTSDFAGCVWQPYEHSVEWTLAEGLGGKTVFVKARDRFLQESDVVAPVMLLYSGWTFATGGGESSPAIGSDGTIYVGSYDGMLYAINPNGTLKWSYATGGGVSSSPAIGSDGTIYVGSDDSQLHAINPNGTLKWSYATGYVYGGVSSSPAIASDGTIYVGSSDDNLYAINPNGTLKWSYATGGDVSSSPAIGSDGTIYVASNDERLYAIEPNGHFKWSYPTGYKSSSPAIGSDGTIYISSGWKVDAIGADATLKWSYDTDGTGYFSPAIGSDGTIYVGSRGTELYAINPDGTLKWSHPTFGSCLSSDDWVGSSPAVGSDGTIYFGWQCGGLYAINPDGVLKWTYDTDGWVYSSPAIGIDGTICIGLHDGLHAINAGPTTLSTTSPWPKFHANNQNTGRH